MPGTVGLCRGLTAATCGGDWAATVLPYPLHCGGKSPFIASSARSFSELENSRFELMSYIGDLSLKHSNDIEKGACPATRVGKFMNLYIKS